MADEFEITQEEGDYISSAKLGVKPSYVPEGWESQRDFLDWVIKVYEADVDYDRENRDWALEDLRFAAGDQWDPDVKRIRELRNRPCLTVNVLPQFVGQVIGERRMNKTQIKVRPFKDGTQEIADVRSGLIKSIELFSRAERVYDAACEDQVTCGIGNFRIEMEYAANDVFDQDIVIRGIPNPLAVVWDRMSVDPTGRDARHVFITDTMPRELYEKNFPDYPCPSELTDAAQLSAGWFDSKTVRITEFWELIEKPATFMLAQDGDVKDITDVPEEEWMQEAWIDPRTNAPKIRESTRTYARMHLVSGFAILSEAYELPLTRLPIIRVEGRVIRVGEDRVRFGLTRFAKDSQRLKNYYRSNFAELLALQPKAVWLAEDKALEGYEKEFREAHLTGDPVMKYKSGTEKPDRVDPPTFPAAYVQAEQMFQQDIKDTTGLHDASLGIKSNEVSGRAIDARKREGDVATVVFHDNLNHAILEGGDVINQLIPIAYDAIRTVRIIGEDDKHKLTTINDPNDENSPNITQGKYDVVLDTGPNFSTQRAEALDAMMTLLQTSPDLMMIAGDIAAKNMEWPGAYEFAERVKRFIKQTNPQVLEDEDNPQPPSPEEQAAAQQAQQMQDAQLQEAAAQLEHAEQMRQAELAERQAQIRKAEADAVIAEENAKKAHFDAISAQAKADQQLTEAEFKPVEKQEQLRQAHERHTQGFIHGEESHGQKMDLNERAASDRSQQMRQRNQQRPGGNQSKGAPRKKGKNNA